MKLWKKDTLNDARFCQMLTIRDANRIARINNEQIAVISKLDVLVFNHTRTNEDHLFASKCLISNIDFKLFFQRHIISVQVSQNIMAVTYGSHSILILLGDPSSTRAECRRSDGEKSLAVNTFNELAAKFKSCLLEMNQ
jgi:S-adenosylmethionine:tRNA-ribosyltransferase-isomerase (queuine synthetase)